MFLSGQTTGIIRRTVATAMGHRKPTRLARRRRASGSMRVQRGGYWDYWASSERVACRSGGYPYITNNNIGARLSRSNA